MAGLDVDGIDITPKMIELHVLAAEFEVADARE